MRLVPVIAIENSAAVCDVEVVETQQATSHLVCVNLPGAAAPALLQPHSDLDGTRSFYSVVSPALHLSGWISGLVLTQMTMLVYGKKATSEAQLPLVLCFVQFATSALLAAAICAVRTGRLPWSPRELWVTICSLAGVWTAGFVLFNASTAVMSPSLVNVVRCMEPLATIVLGFAMGERYSVATLATLMPICGGVALASVRANVVRGTPHRLLHRRLVLFVVQFTGKSLLPPTGLGLAMLSNACFCARPYFRLRLQKHHANTMDVISEFFNITLVASLMLPPFCLLLEGAEMMSVIRLSKEGVLLTFSGHTLVSSVFFSLYQYAQVIHHSSAGANAASRK